MDTSEAYQKELELLNAESYLEVPNRAELLKDLKDLTPEDITALRELDFEVTVDNNVKNLVTLKDHVTSATGKILKLFGFSSFCMKAIQELEKRDSNPTILKQALDLDPEFRFTDLLFTVKGNSEEHQALTVQCQEYFKGTTALEAVVKENASNAKENSLNLQALDNRFGVLSVLTEGDNLKNMVYYAKSAREHQEFKLRAEKELITLAATIDKQQDAINELDTLKYMDLKTIQRQIDEIQKKSEDAKVHITGTKKAPELATMNPIEYRAFKENFLLHSKTHKWTEEISKQQLLLSVNSTIHSTLKMAVPNWNAASLNDILKAWDKRICPDSVASLAVMHLSGLQQNLNEDTIAYLTRGHELYVRARLPSDTQQDPETDKAFVLKLIHGIRDKNLVNHLRRWDPKTISELRERINSEMAILNMDQTAQAPSQTISKIDGMDSNEKPAPPCALCQDDKHATVHCAKLSSTLAEIAKNIIPTQGYLRGRGRGGNRGNGRGRGGYRGRGRGNGNNRGNNSKRPFQPSTTDNTSNSENSPKQIKTESDAKN